MKFIVLIVQGILAATILVSYAEASPLEQNIENKLGMYISCAQALPDEDKSIFEKNMAENYASWKMRYRSVIEKIESSESFKNKRSAIVSINPAQIDQWQKLFLKGVCEKFSREFSSWEVVEPNAADSRLTSPEGTWNTFKTALKNGNKDVAIMCLVGSARNMFSEMIFEMSNDELDKLSKSFVKFVINEQSDSSMKSGLLQRSNGNAGVMTFVLIDGNWRISSM